MNIFLVFVTVNQNTCNAQVKNVIIIFHFNNRHRLCQNFLAIHTHILHVACESMLQVISYQSSLNTDKLSKPVTIAMNYFAIKHMALVIRLHIKRIDTSINRATSHIKKYFSCKHIKLKSIFVFVETTKSL